MQPVSSQTEQMAERLHHDFWPRLPWPEEPQLPLLHLTMMKDAALRYAWLATKTHQTGEDEKLWRGAKVLGARHVLPSAVRRPSMS
jgi:hypothetical protein